MNHSETTTELIQDFVQYCGFKPRCQEFSNQVYGAKETTFRIGGQFDSFIEPDSHEQLAKSLSWLKYNNQPFKYLGFGSNLLVNSSGVRAWVIRLGRTFAAKKIESENVFKLGAISSLTSFARDMAQQGYGGMEFAAGIPASIGGAVRMNAGAHHSEISQVLESVEGFNAEGEFLQIEAKDLNFSYRHCSLPDDFLVTAASFRLCKSDKDQVMAHLSKNLEYRKRTQPLTLPSAGSVFRNPSPELSAGALIDSLGLKGLSSGSAQISELHANWIVNPQKKASSQDVLNLISTCQKQAFESRAIWLQPELVVW